MQSNLAIKFIPAVSDERRLDVSVSGDEATIKLSTWAEGLGWCGQKTMSLDEAMLDDLHRMIAAARVRLKEQKCESVSSSSSDNVLAFPMLS